MRTIIASPHEKSRKRACGAFDMSGLSVIPFLWYSSMHHDITYSSSISKEAHVYAPITPNQWQGLYSHDTSMVSYTQSNTRELQQGDQNRQKRESRPGKGGRINKPWNESKREGTKPSLLLQFAFKFKFSIYTALSMIQQLYHMYIHKKRAQLYRTTYSIVFI